MALEIFLIVLFICVLKECCLRVSLALFRVRSVAKVVEEFATIFLHLCNLLVGIHVAITTQVTFWVCLQFVGLSLGAFGDVVFDALLNHRAFNGVDGEEESEKLEQDWLRVKHHILVADKISWNDWFYLLAHGFCAVIGSLREQLYELLPPLGISIAKWNFCCLGVGRSSVEVGHRHE